MATSGVNDEKQAIVKRLLDSVKQCQTRFGGRSELATDMDTRVVELCESLESALTHRLRRNRNLIHYKRKSGINGVTRSTSATQGFGESHETVVCFWHFVSLHLTRHEFDRYRLLRNVRTDFGRGKAWLRSSLNEHSLERYVLTLLTDSTTLRNDFYEENAFMRDEDINSVLPTISRGLNSILFAINIDNAEFDYDSKIIEKNSRSDPLPVLCKSETIPGIRRRRHKVNVISLSDDDNDQMDHLNAARSAPTTCLSSPDSIFSDRQMSSTYMTGNCSSLISQSADRNVVLTPLGAENVNNTLELIVDNTSVCDSDKLSLNENQESKIESSQETNVESNADKDELERLRAENQCMKEMFEEKVSKLMAQNDSLNKDNDLLQVQLNKYIAAVQLLKYSGNTGQDVIIDNNTNTGAIGQSFEESKAFESQNQSYYNEINEYEKKLVEVAEMHAELVEFNQHLHRVIAQKDALIARLKDELVHLRGPLPEVNEVTEDLISVSSDFETDLSIQSTISPLIHIWIPTVFLAGGQKSKSHHIYQIYVRIKEEEWNVYRRYSQFHSLHKSLRKKIQILNTFDFPPKKTIGNKDSKVVQERRKRLENYLRNLINALQTQHNNITDKQHLIAVLPFLSERFVQSQGRSRSETHLNFSTNDPPQEHHYMGL